MSDRALYLRAAKDLRANSGQWAAYESEGNCVVLAGPGSGKTKTLTIKLARMLSEDVEPPRGLACITYNNECARELEQRLDALGVEPSHRVFIGTVHSFSLTQILLPYAGAAGLDVPANFAVATQQQQRIALENAFNDVIGGPENPQNWRLRMDRYRRTNLDRSSEEWRGADSQLADLIEAYEADLRGRGLIDFDDMPLLAERALSQHPWIRQAIFAKYPILAVDEYQDLGRALHQMVMRLCFETGIRLFAVGDVDQSIYGFTGAHPQLLQRLSERGDVETVRLALNYRSGKRIVQASEYALGEERGYEAPEDAEQGTIYFHPRTGTYAAQAEFLIATLLPEIRERVGGGLALGQIAVLYPAAFIGDEVANAAQRNGIGFIRTDTNAIYPRSSRLMRWLEQAAIWCCGGWKFGLPRLSKLVSEGQRIFAEAIVTEDDAIAFQRGLLTFLWNRRLPHYVLNDWLTEIRDNLIYELVKASRTLADELEILQTFLSRLDATGDLEGMTLGQFAGYGEANDRINLSTLHSAKGREFKVTILIGMDANRIPRAGATTAEKREARRLFYVGFTRARTEVHIIFSQWSPSEFVSELSERLQDTPV